MKVSLNWLRELIELETDDPAELSEILASLGHEVEGYEVLDVDFKGVVVGRVETVQPHPDADKIRLCSVTTGGPATEIVCGAWNFEAGGVVPVAVPGAILSGDMEIGARTIRGVTSHGMICSARELGLGEEHEGIMVLDPSTPIGSDFSDHVPYPDVVFDLTITPNRPDAMSMVGIARELAAYWAGSVTEPEIAFQQVDFDPAIAIEIDDPNGCLRFVGREVRDVAVGPSPLWMQLRLRAADVRPISNVVDITNYVMLEYGQPLHGFDADKIREQRIIVRRAEPVEPFRTLDGIDRELTGEDLVVADGVGPSGLAGVMGGQISELADDTTNVLIEAAAWDPPTILFMAARHQIRTEASARFERGVDPNLPPTAATRAAQLMVEHAGGKALATMTDVVARPVTPWTIELPMSWVRRLLGDVVDPAEAVTLLTRLGMSVKGDDPFQVTIPTSRPDLTRAVDLVEEIARLHGYDNFPETLPAGSGGGLTEPQRKERALRSVLAGAGYSEAQTYSFHGRQELDRLSLPPDDPRRIGIEVKNPLREEESLLRTTVLPGLLEALRYNQSHGAEDIALFEIGRVFYDRVSPVYEKVPDQPVHVAFVAAGHLGSETLGAGSPAVDVYTATATWRLLVDSLGLPDAELVGSDVAPLHPGRGATVSVAGREVGYVGELRPSVARAFELEGRIAVGELLLEPLVAPRGLWQFAEPSTYPPVVFDLAFDLPEATPASAVTGAVRQHAGEMLETLDVFDEFVGAPLAEGRKSLALRLVFRAADRTLVADELGPLREAIVTGVQSELDGRLRGGP